MSVAATVEKETAVDDEMELAKARGDFLDAGEDMPKEDVEPVKAAKDPDTDKEDAEAAEEVKAEKPEKEERATTVPHARFNEVNLRKKELEERVAYLEGLVASQNKPESQETKPAAPAPDIDDLEDQAVNALLEGDLDKHREIRRQIRAADRENYRAEVQRELEASNTTAAINNAAAAAINKYPFLHPETGDPEKLQEVIDWRDMYIARGHAPAEAITMAADKVGALYAPPEPTAPAEEKVDARKGQAVERGIKASEATPPATQSTGVGTRSAQSKIDVEHMSSKQFKSLSDEEKARLRGDII